MKLLLGYLIGKKNVEILIALALRILAIMSAYFLCTELAYAAHAAIPAPGADFTFFDASAPNGLMGEIDKAGQTMMSKIITAVKPTFAILATIEIAWAALLWTIEKDNLTAFASEFIQKLITICFFYYLLDHGPEIVAAIIDSMTNAGAAAASITTPTVDGVIATGLAICNMMWTKTYDNIFDIIVNFPLLGVAILVSIIVVVAYVIAAAQLLCVHIEQVVVLAAGAIFLGFGASSWTQDWVNKYLTYALTVGLRVLVLLIILGIMNTMAGSLEAEFAKDGAIVKFQLIGMLKCAIYAIIEGLLAVRAPDMASALMQGGIGMSAGTAVSAAKGMMSTGQAMVGAPATAAKGLATAGINTAKLTKSSISASKAAGGSAAGGVASAVGSLAQEGGRSLLNHVTGKSASHGWDDKTMTAEEKQMEKDQGISHNRGMFDRAQRNAAAKSMASMTDAGGNHNSGGGAKGGGSGREVPRVSGRPSPQTTEVKHSTTGKVAGKTAQHVIDKKIDVAEKKIEKGVTRQVTKALVPEIGPMALPVGLVAGKAAGKLTGGTAKKINRSVFDAKKNPGKEK